MILIHISNFDFVTSYERQICSDSCKTPIQIFCTKMNKSNRMTNGKTEPKLIHKMDYNCYII